MPYYKLIHWNKQEAKQLASHIKSGINKVDFDLPAGPQFFKEIQINPPLVFIISLARLPSQGRDMALMIRQKKATRNVPIIFVDGDKEKVDKTKKLIPDAVYTSWNKINSSINKALKNAPKDPVVHKSLFASYEGTPLIKKLGIKPNSVLSLINSPKYFHKILGKLPEKVKFREDLKAKSDIIIWFTKKESEITRRIKTVSNALTEKGSVWIAWPKKTSGLETGINQIIVRKIGLASGLVDYKICSIDKTWSALLFTIRKSK